MGSGRSAQAALCLPVGILLVALVSPVLHHLVVPHRGGGARDLHAGQPHPVGKVRAPWKVGLQEGC